MRVVFFLLDAFKEEYISEENTPFLYSKAKEGKHIARIIPSAGFCERTEIFFGVRPDESGFFTAIGFDSENGIYRNQKWLGLFSWFERLLSSIVFRIWKSKFNTFSRYFQKVLQRVYFKFFGKREKLKPYKIPFEFLPYFTLTEDQYELNSIEKIGGKASLFKIVEAQKKETYFDAFTSLGSVSGGTDTDRMRLAVNASKDESYGFFPIYINVADYVGHHSGPNSNELKIALRKLDAELKENVGQMVEHDPKCQFVFLGDHGMTQVAKTVDVRMKILEISTKYKLIPRKDFVFFLDSTLVRLWFLSPKAERIFKRYFTEDPFFVDNGEIISEELAKKYSIPVNDRRYGDILWWANEGILVFPDFFHNDKALSGMHGYKPDTQSTYGTCIIWGSGNSSGSNQKELELHKVYDELKELILS